MPVNKITPSDRGICTQFINPALEQIGYLIVGNLDRGILSKSPEIAKKILTGTVIRNVSTSFEPAL